MKVGIVGLGLIGASFAKAYKEAGHEVLVRDIDPSAVIMGKLSGFVDGELSEEELKTCDLVIVCLYPEAAAKYIEDNGSNFNKEGLVIDACGN